MKDGSPITAAPPAKPPLPEVSIAPLLAALGPQAAATDLGLIRLAFDFANEAHAGQYRSSGEPYILHPVQAAATLARMRVPASIVAATLLHDVPEDTARTVEDIRGVFGPDIASMVSGITKLGTLKYRGIERYIENLRKMFIAVASDVRVILIKFADRIHNLQTLDALPPEKRARIALESLEIYAPIANRLGLHELRVQLEDLSFKHVMPDEYDWVKGLMTKVIGGKQPYTDRVKRLIEADLAAADVPFLKVGGRVKHLYSLYKKLLKHDRDIARIHDLVAMRVLVPEIADCYAALGHVQGRWKPVKDRFKDYIARPKANGYRSLHTTVFCEGGEIVEIQIRTGQMHDEAERGIAAHWQYDEQGKRSVPVQRDGSLTWVRNLNEVASEPEEEEELAERLGRLRIDVFSERIFVFTPKGDVIDLPQGATPVDFAYAIHSDIGDRAAFARVNDRQVPLDRALSSGDCCEIVTDKNRKGPNPDWLGFVRTGHARTHIKAYARTTKAKWATEKDLTEAAAPQRDKTERRHRDDRPKRRKIRESKGAKPKKT
jgi:GTP pyrophosphokinase